MIFLSTSRAQFLFSNISLWNLFIYYRDNILHVDVFMRELSYEEIEQQEAYSMTNLWSKWRADLCLCLLLVS